MSAITIFAGAVDGQSVPGAAYPGAKAKDPGKSISNKSFPPGYAIDDRRPREFRLPILTRAETIRSGRRPLPQTGIRREIPTGALTNATVVNLPDGRKLWRATLVSPGATAIRLHFRRFDANGGQLWVYAPPSRGEAPRAEGPFSHKGPFADGDFWTGEIGSHSVTVEFLEASPGSEKVLPPFEIESLVHIWEAVGPSDMELLGVNNDIVGSDRIMTPKAFVSGVSRMDVPPTDKHVEAYCHLDVRCYPTYQNAASGVVQLNYVGDDGGSYVCSGSMINTRAASFKPYMLTAYHCISSPSEARSISARFRYQTSICGGAPPSPNLVPTITGGTYLAGAPIPRGDYSLILLAGDPPPGTYFLGWDSRSDAIALGDPGVGIHHPSGSWKRISFGTRTLDQDATVAGEPAPASLYYRTSWNQGRTEGGSSGSPLLNSSGQILGTLTYGSIVPTGLTVCEINPEIAGYGRFSNAYASIRAFLEDTPPPSLTVTPTSLSFSVVNGQYFGPAQQAVTIRTQSASSIPFVLATSAKWIGLSTVGGSVSATSPATVTVSLDLSSIASTTSLAGSIALSSGTLTPINIGVQANITVSRSRVTITVDPNPVSQQETDADGYSWYFKVVLKESANVTTRVTSFEFDGINYSNSIVSWFGSDLLPAGSSLIASLRSKGVVSNRAFAAGGVDTGSGQPWTTGITVPFLGRPSGAILSMDSAPAFVRQNPTSTNCPWYQQLVLRETGGFAVTLTSFTAGGNTLSGAIAEYWGTTKLAANGTLRAGICWTGVQPPTSITVQVGGTDSSGRFVSTTVTGTFTGPAASPTTMSTSAVSLLFNAPTGYSSPLASTLNLIIGSNSAYWTARLLSDDNSTTSWLTVSPLSGSGSSSLRVTIPPGASAGSHEATLVIQCVDAIPQLLNIPVKVVIGAATSAPAIDPAGIVSNASYRPVAAPGMILSVFGQRLALGTEAASALPLPISLQGTAAWINGRRAPFYYVSPTLINLQVPYETEIGVATLTITVNGRSSSQQFPVASAAPGIYTSDGRAIVPVGEVARAEYGVLFVTGQGSLYPALQTGVAPPPTTPIENLPVPAASVAITVGGVPANLLFAGNPYAVAGVIQVNYQVASGTPTGIQPVIVRIGDKLSPPAYILVR